MPERRVTIRDLWRMKERGEKIPVLTAYDYTSAQILDAAGIPMILVGDSLGMVVQGYETTLPVTLEEMLYHTRAVVRGAKRALIVGDMPFMTYQVSVEQALQNAARFLQEGGCQAVKLEGGRRVLPAVARLVENGIPVMGHLGFTPQSVHQFGGQIVQGRTVEAAETLLRDALALEEAGAFSIVLECVPAPLAAEMTRRLRIPTIGIGSGPHCDGQVQVFHDVFGLYTDFVPKHTKRYLHLAEQLRAAAQQYMEEVRCGLFPTEEHSFSMDPAVLEEAVRRVEGGKD